MSEEELVALCIRGDEASWQALYRRFYPLVYKIVCWGRWNFPREQTEDIIQEVFSALVISLRSFKFRSQLNTYITDNAKNKCISEIRRKDTLKRGKGIIHRSLYEVRADGSLAIDPADRGKRPEELLVDIEDREALKMAIGKLSYKCQKIVELRYLQAMSCKQIAEELDIPKGTVYSRMSRCLLKLKEIYQKLISD